MPLTPVGQQIVGKAQEAAENAVDPEHPVVSGDAGNTQIVGNEIKAETEALIRGSATEESDDADH